MPLKLLRLLRIAEPAFRIEAHWIGEYRVVKEIFGDVHTEGRLESCLLVFQST